jgi:hypothetical protein
MGWKGGVEGALMVVIAIGFRGVFTANIYDGMASGKDGRIAGSNEG